MNKTIGFLIILIITSCTTIEIEERSIFDAHPTITTGTFDYEGVTLHQQILSTDDGEELDSWLIEHEDAAATVLYLGGNGFLMVKSRPWLDVYTALPVNLIMIDYRGYGQSTGEPTVDGVKRDAESAYDFASDYSERTETDLLIHGHSMGSLLATYLVNEFEATGYILESPITNAEDLTRNIVPRFLRPFIRFDIPEAVREQNNIQRVQHIEIPLLLLGGENDNVTPFFMAEKLYEKSASEQKELVQIPAGGHNDLPFDSAYRDAVKEFIENRVN